MGSQTGSGLHWPRSITAGDSAPILSNSVNEHPVGVVATGEGRGRWEKEADGDEIDRRRLVVKMDVLVSSRLRKRRALPPWRSQRVRGKAMRRRQGPNLQGQVDRAQAPTVPQW